MRSLAVALSLFALAPAARADAPAERVVRIEARRFAFAPESITVVKGAPVVLELVSLDRRHGFDLPAFGIKVDVRPHEVTRVRLVPDRTGTFAFHCHVFCGEGHEEMTGQLVVVER